MMNTHLFVLLLLAGSAFSEILDSEQALVNTIPDPGLATSGQTLPKNHPPAYNQLPGITIPQNNPHHLSIPQVAADAEVDPGMPRIEPDPSVDAKMGRMLPHVGMELVNPKPRYKPFGYQLLNIIEVKGE